MNETPLFFDQGNYRLFGVLHEPEVNGDGQAFVFCHPFAEEKLWAHRVYVSFARQLASRGVTVFRFDYTGYGDSEGTFLLGTIKQQVSDTLRATEFVKEKCPGVTRVGFLGLRLGASLALMVARELQESGPLILWDPVIDGESFIQDFLRSSLATQLAVYGEVRENRDKLIEKLRQGELVNVDGYDLNLDVYEQIAAICAGTFTDVKATPKLVVQIGRTVRPKKALTSFSNELGADLRCVVEESFWREIKRFYSQAPDLFDTTLNWLEGEL